MDFKQKRLLSVKEAASYLGLAPKTIYNGSGRKAKSPFPLKPIHYGRRVLFDRLALDQWVDSLSQVDTESIG